MYAVLRRYHFDPKHSDELSRKVQASFVPFVRETAGFEAYYWLDTGQGEGISISIFQTQAGAEESIRSAATFVQQNLASLLGAPEVIRGVVKVQA